MHDLAGQLLLPPAKSSSATLFMNVTQPSWSSM